MASPPETTSLDVLLVEDDPTLKDTLALHLSAEGWTVRATDHGDEALKLCEARPPEVVVLDVMLPGRSGLEVCAALRARFSPSPGVVMVTARSAEVDVLLGLDVGADDYVIKPCRPREIVARVKALARRLRPPMPSVPQSAAPEEVLQRGALRIDQAARRVSVRGVPLRLTVTEFELLRVLARTPDRVYSRAELLQEVFDTSHEGYARNVDCHVTRVRRKLEAAGLDPTPIQTAHGAGYRFVTPTP